VPKSPAGSAAKSPNHSANLERFGKVWGRQ
jgi:hypothetical protein